MREALSTKVPYYDRETGFYTLSGLLDLKKSILLSADFCANTQKFQSRYGEIRVQNFDHQFEKKRRSENISTDN